jgi:hypothetical protein
MAQEVLVKESISTGMIAAGERLARHLNVSELPIDALLWFYSPEENSWRYLVASPEVSKSGPKAVYQKIRGIVEQLSEGEIVPWDDIFVVDSNDPFIQLLRQGIRTGDDIAQIRFSRNVVNGVLIEDAYIYKLK